MNDEITVANRARWEAEVLKKNGFTVPWLDLDKDDILRYARDQLDPVPYHLYQIYPAYLLRDVADKDVLCLAAGGGQQSAVFGLLDARVTVIDFTQGQLNGDITAAKHYGYPVETICANIRDLSAIEDASFDLIYQGPSMSWVPSVHEIYRGVSRIVRPGGQYRVDFGNPATHFLEWDGECYRITEPYTERVFRYPEDGAFDFRHYLGDVFNGLVDNGFRIERVEERAWTQPDIEATPGSWAHEMAYNIRTESGGFTVEALNIRKARTSDSEFVFTVKKAAFREYVERVWGWDDNYQRERHNKEFASYDFHIIQFRETDVGFFIMFIETLYARGPKPQRGGNLCRGLQVLLLIPTYHRRIPNIVQNL